MILEIIYAFKIRLSISFGVCLIFDWLVSYLTYPSSSVSKLISLIDIPNTLSLGSSGLYFLPSLLNTVNLNKSGNLFV